MVDGKRGNDLGRVFDLLVAVVATIIGLLGTLVLSVVYRLADLVNRFRRALQDLREFLAGAASRVGIGKRE